MIPAFTDNVFSSWIVKWTIGSMTILLIGIILYVNIFAGYSSVAFEDHHARLLALTSDHYAVTALLYVGLYCFLAALSLPGKFMLTLAGGYLFGPVMGTLYVIWGATTGAAMAFLATRYVLHDRVRHIVDRHLPDFQTRVKSHAFTALLVFRLLPLVPFTILNLLAGLTHIKFPTFLGATMIGIFPCVFFLAYVGSRLPTIAELSTLDSSAFALPLSGSAILALIPLALHYFTCAGRARFDAPTTCDDVAETFPLGQPNPVRHRPSSLHP